MMSMQSCLLCLLIHICPFPYLFLQGVDESMFIHQPLVYCHFAQGVGEPRYHQVPILSSELLCLLAKAHVAHFQSSVYSLLTVVMK